MLPRILTLLQHRDADLKIVSYCSADPKHSHVVDVEAALKAGGDVFIDQNWQQAQICPICHGRGGGISIQLTKEIAVSSPKL